MSLELRARAAAAALTVFGFNPGQRRGPDGRWVKMGGAGSAGGRPRGGRRTREAWRAERDRYNDSVLDYADKQIEGLARDGRDAPLLADKIENVRYLRGDEDFDAEIDELRGTLENYFDHRVELPVAPPPFELWAAQGKPARQPAEDPLYRVRREEFNDEVIADATEQRLAFGNPEMYPELDELPGVPPGEQRDAIVDRIVDRINLRADTGEGYVAPAKVAIPMRQPKDDPFYREARTAYNQTALDAIESRWNFTQPGRVDEIVALRNAPEGPERDAAIDRLAEEHNAALAAEGAFEQPLYPPARTGPRFNPERGPQGARPDPTASYAKRRAALARSVRGGALAETKLAQGSLGETRKFELTDGTAAIYKRALRDWDNNWDRPPFTKKDQADAEELSAMVAGVLGSLAPAVSRAGDDEVYMEFVDGQLAEVRWPHRGTPPRGVTAGPDGVRLGLLDALIENTDRHAGNYLVDDQDRLRPIDHGLAFSRTHGKDAFGNRTRRSTDSLTAVSPFTLEHFASPSGQFYDSNPLTARDVRKARRALARLKGQFERRGQADWHVSMMERFEQIASRAQGTEDML